MAATILVVGIIGMIQALAVGAEMVASAKRQTLASQILAHEMEKIRLKSWTEIEALADSSAATYTDTRFTPLIRVSGATYRLAVDVDTPMTNLREVVLTVSWVVMSSRTNADGTRVTFSFSRSASSYFGKNGLNLSHQRS